MKVYIVSDPQGDPIAVFESRKDATAWMATRPWVMLWPMKLRRKQR